MLCNFKAENVHKQPKLLIFFYRLNAQKVMSHDFSLHLPKHWIWHFCMWRFRRWNQRWGLCLRIDLALTCTKWWSCRLRPILALGCAFPCFQRLWTGSSPSWMNDSFFPKHLTSLSQWVFHVISWAEGKRAYTRGGWNPGRKWVRLAPPRTWGAPCENLQAEKRRGRRVSKLWILQFLVHRFLTSKSNSKGKTTRRAASSSPDLPLQLHG